MGKENEQGVGRSAGQGHERDEEKVCGSVWPAVEARKERLAENKWKIEKKWYSGKQSG